MLLSFSLGQTVIGFSTAPPFHCWNGSWIVPFPGRRRGMISRRKGENDGKISLDSIFYRRYMLGEKCYWTYA